MRWVIKLNQGDYLEWRSGYDWGRTSKLGATPYDSREEAQEWIDRLQVAAFGARPYQLIARDIGQDGRP